jgi:hypothetical protein
MIVTIDVTMLDNSIVNDGGIILLKLDNNRSIDDQFHAYAAEK